MQNFLSWLNLGENTWIVHVFLVVFVTVVANYIIGRIINRIHLRFEQTENRWDDAVLLSARQPVLLLVWVIGISIAAEIVRDVAVSDIFEYTAVVRRIAIILLLTMFLIRLIRHGEENFLQKKAENELEADEITVKIVGRLLRLTVLITAGLVVLQTLGISVTGVVAFGGIGGIAIGFAAQDLLSNFFGGLMIYLDRPFTVGDWIRSPDREIEGVVEDIGWRLTIIRTFDKRPLYIPNSVFTKIAVENPSRMHNRRILETFGLRYSDAGRMGAVVAEVRKMLGDHPDIDTDSTMIANFTSLAPSSLDFFIMAYTRTTNWVEFHAVKQDILLKVIDIIHTHGADIAFPTRTLDGIPEFIGNRGEPAPAEG